MRRNAAATVLLCCCLGLVACGSRRAEPPKIDATVVTPGKVVPFSYPGGDVTFSYPSNWVLQPRTPPGIATVSTGGGSATMWAYRSVALVTDEVADNAAMKRYLVSLKERDPGFQVESAGLLLVFEKPGFEVRGTTEVNGRPTKVRSVHIFNGVGEYVADMLADPSKFDEIDRTVFQPLLLSWRFYGRPPGASDAGSSAQSPTATPSG